MKMRLKIKLYVCKWSNGILVQCRAKLEEQSNGKGKEIWDIQCQTEGVPGKDRQRRQRRN